MSVAWILHDTVESSSATVQDIVAAFGSQTSQILAAMTEDPTLDSIKQRRSVLLPQIAAFGPDATRGLRR